MNKFIPPILLSLLITCISNISMGSSVGEFTVLNLLKPEIQNLLHIPVFGLLAGLWLRAFRHLKKTFTICLIGALVVTIVFGIIDELHQKFVPGRNADLRDIIFNTIGAVLGIVTYTTYRYWRKSKIQYRST